MDPNVQVNIMGKCGGELLSSDSTPKATKLCTRATGCPCVCQSSGGTPVVVVYNLAITNVARIVRCESVNHP